MVEKLKICLRQKVEVLLILQSFNCSALYLFIFLFASCSGNPDSIIHPDKQYLLTNKISMKHRPVVSGASSFLVRLNGSVYLCTAKHLTQGPMGFEPALELSTYNDSVNYWRAFPRTNKLSGETIETGKLLHNGAEKEDVILLELKKEAEQTGVLQADFRRLKEGERLRILGCQYKDAGCHQQEYSGTFIRYTANDEIEMRVDSPDVEMVGMSGAPVVDDNLKVVGIVSAGLLTKEMLKAYIAPVDFLKRIPLE